MNFEKDIFISYAHLDEKEVGDDIKGWVSDFHETLQTLVSQKWGRTPQIWRDDRLQGNDFFAPEILAQFPKLKLLISIITPRYLQSKWCHDEVEAFFAAAEQNGGISIENKARIFKVIKTPVEINDEPEKIRDILGYEFYRKDPTSDRVREYLKAFGKEFEQAFYLTIDDVAQDVVKLLKKLSEPANITATSPKGKIYLADTSDDLKDFHDSIKRELEDAGYLVFPNKNLPLAADKFIHEVESFMNDCSLSVHLIGTEDYGIVPGKTDKSILVLQNEVAAKQSASENFNRLIWLVPQQSPLDAGALKIDDVRLSGFIEQLKNTEQLHQGSDLLEGTLEDFKHAIFDTLNKQEEKRELERLKASAAAAVVATPKAATSAGGEMDPKIIYIICDKRDLDEVKALSSYLDTIGHEIKLPRFDGDQAALLKRHEDLLQSCDAVMVYWGYSDQNWMESMTLSVNKTKALRTTPYLARYAYIAGPVSPEKEDYSTKLLTIINGTGGFNADSLNDFIMKLK